MCIFTIKQVRLLRLIRKGVFDSFAFNATYGYKYYLTISVYLHDLHCRLERPCVRSAQLFQAPQTRDYGPSYQRYILDQELLHTVIITLFPKYEPCYHREQCHRDRHFD